MLKNAKKIFSGWFWAWFWITIILVIGMTVFGQPHANWMAGVIMASFMLLPVRDWIIRLIIWALDYVSSINTPFKDKIHKHATYNRLVDPSKREENPGFYLALRTSVSTVCVIMALLWMVFQGTAFNVVYSWLHTIEFILRGRIGFLNMLLYVLLLLGFFYLVFWFIGQVLNGEIYVQNGPNRGKIDWAHASWKIALMIGGFYFKIIFTGILLQYTGSMIWSSLVFWTVVIGFPILAFKVKNLLQSLIQGNNNNP